MVLKFFSFWFIALCFLSLFIFYLPFMFIGIKLLSRPYVMRVSIDSIQDKVLSGRYESKHPTYPAIVYFSGIDGSGKTTQINLLRREMDKTNLRHKHVHLRWAAFFSWPFFAFCRVFGYTKWKQNIYGIWSAEHYFYKNKAISTLYSWLFAFDMTLRTHIMVDFSLYRGNVIFSDRCSIDGLVDLMADTRDFNLWKKMPGRILMSLLSSPSHVLVFDFDENKSFERKRDTTSLEFIAIRRKLFLELANNFGLHVLNADKPKDVLYSEIVAFLSKRPFWYFCSKPST